MAAHSHLELSGDDFTRWLESRMNQRAPAAVVRFGDGEAKLLMADPDNAGSMKPVGRTLRRQTGSSLPTEAMLELKALVRHAFDSADVLGILPGDRFIDEHKRWLAKLATLHAHSVATGRRPAPLTHCLLGHQIVDTLPTLLGGRRVSVITCRNVKPVLEADWGLEDVAVYQVPSQHAVRDVDGDYEAVMHDVPIWPDGHARVSATLTVRERGEVFLVGAGLFGKDLCIRVRDLGGIALDMGSALDTIASKITRGPKRRVLDLHSRGLSVLQIAEQLSHYYGQPVRSREVTAFLEGVGDP